MPTSYPIDWAREIRTRFGVDGLRNTFRNFPNLVGQYSENSYGHWIAVCSENVCRVPGCYEARESHDVWECADCSENEGSAYFHVEHRRCATCNRCTTGNHCECPACAGCGRRRGYTMCGECQRGTQCCCACSECYDCNARGTMCSCGRCGTCCRGHVKFVTNPLQFHTGESTILTPSQRYIAAEIEVDGMRGSLTGIKTSFEDLNKVIKKWHASVVRDGSLSGDGFEINTAPARGVSFETQIQEICSSIGASALITERCGLHIHVDARDLTYEDIKALIALYKSIERGLFLTQPRERRKSEYCLPCGDIYSKESDLDYAVYSKEHSKERIEEMKKNKYATARYFALNLHSWFYRGTVESRLHTGTVNAEEIIAWGSLLAMILDAAKERYKPVGTTSKQKLLNLTVMNPSVHSYVVSRLAKYGQGQAFPMGQTNRRRR